MPHRKVLFVSLPPQASSQQSWPAISSPEPPKFSLIIVATITLITLILLVMIEQSILFVDALPLSQSSSSAAWSSRNVDTGAIRLDLTSSLSSLPINQLPPPPPAPLLLPQSRFRSHSINPKIDLIWQFFDYLRRNDALIGFRKWSSKIFRKLLKRNVAPKRFSTNRSKRGLVEQRITDVLARLRDQKLEEFQNKYKTKNEKDPLTAESSSSSFSWSVIDNTINNDDRHYHQQQHHHDEDDKIDFEKTKTNFENLPNNKSVDYNNNQQPQFEALKDSHEKKEPENALDAISRADIELISRLLNLHASPTLLRNRRTQANLETHQVLNNLELRDEQIKQIIRDTMISENEILRTIVAPFFKYLLAKSKRRNRPSKFTLPDNYEIFAIVEQNLKYFIEQQKDQKSLQNYKTRHGRNYFFCCPSPKSKRKEREMHILISSFFASEFQRTLTLLKRASNVFLTKYLVPLFGLRKRKQ